MPKPKYRISRLLLTALKWKIEELIFFKISNKADCKRLSEIILLKKNKIISESTLYRLFLWDGNQSAPYIHTLDILAEFLDFKNWSELESYLNGLQNFKFLFGVYPIEQQYQSLLSINIHHGSLRPLYNFLEQFSSELAFEKKIILGEEIYLALKSNPNSNIEFFKQFHSLPIVRQGFFEILADPEFKIKDYEVGLSYYLKNLKNENSNNYLQDFVFANSLLIRFYFFKKNKGKVLEIGKLLYVNYNLNEKDLKEFYVYPKIRYYAYKLLYSFVIEGFDYQYWEWLYEYSIQLINSLEPLIEKRIVIHTLLETLHINPSLQEKTFNELMISFPFIFTFYPSYVFKLPIKERLKFLDTNSAKFINGTL